jgi:hypothetical protein
MSDSLRSAAPPNKPLQTQTACPTAGRRRHGKRFNEGLNRNVGMVWPEILGVKRKVRLDRKFMIDGDIARTALDILILSQ